MKRMIGASILCSGLAIALPWGANTAKAGELSDAEILQRLDKLEKENAALKARFNRVEKASTAQARTITTQAPAPAAGSVATAMAQGGPIKGPPVKYVRVCDAYGAGFFYIPGAEGCIKIGGYLRLQGAANASGDGIVAGADTNLTQGRSNRADTNDFNYQARAALSLDVRFPTEWGLLRGYVRGGVQVVTPFNDPLPSSSLFNTNGQPIVWWDRGFIEFAGFTVGKQRSFFDMFDPVSSYTYGNPRTTGDTDLTGAFLAGYRYRFGNGWSAAVSVEDPGSHNKIGVCDGSAACFAINGGITTDNGLSNQSTSARGLGMPDIIANVRLEQPWGYLGFSGAVHKVAGSYYTTPGNVGSGHPDDKFGYAVSAAQKFYIPGMGGDSIGFNVVYSLGAPGYAAKGAAWQIYNGSSSVGIGWGLDGLFDVVGGAGGAATGSIELTKAWSINAAYQHIWNPQWNTSVYGGYTSISYNANATNIINSHLPGAAGSVVCGMPVAGAVWPPLNIPAGGGGNSCNADYSFWQIGSRTAYRPVDWLELGIDATYTRLNTAYAGSSTGLYPANGVRPATNQIADQDVISVLARMQLNFYP